MKLITAVFIIVLFIFMPELKGEPNSVLLNLYTIITFIIIGGHFLNNAGNNNWCRLDVFFILGIVIVHFQWPIMYAIGNISPVGVSRVSNGLYFMNYGTWLSSIGLAFWIIGYNYVRLKPLKATENNNFGTLKYKGILLFSVSSFIIFLLISGEGFLTGSVYKTGVESDESGIGAYFRLFSFISLLLLIAISLYNSTKNRGFLECIFSIPKSLVFYYFLYLVIFVVSGDRGAAIQILISSFVLYGMLVKPIGLSRVLFFIGLGATLITIIGLSRGLDSSGGSGALLASNIASLGLYSLTIELANSSRVLYTGLEYINNGGDYFFGQLWLSKFLSLIPFLQGVFVKTFDIADFEMGSAGFITYLTFGKNPPMGEGTSYIVDIYLNFSTLGVMIFSLIFGFLCKFVERQYYITHSVIPLIIITFIAAESLYFGRGTISSLFRPITWSLALYYFFSYARYKLPSGKII